MTRLVISLAAFSSCLIAVIATVMDAPSQKPDPIDLILSGRLDQNIGDGIVWTMFAVGAPFCAACSLLWVIRELSLLIGHASRQQEKE